MRRDWSPSGPARTSPLPAKCTYFTLDWKTHQSKQWSSTPLHPTVGPLDSKRCQNPRPPHHTPPPKDLICNIVVTKIADLGDHDGGADGLEREKWTTIKAHLQNEHSYKFRKTYINWVESNEGPPIIMTDTYPYWYKEMIDSIKHFVSSPSIPEGLTCFPFA